MLNVNYFFTTLFLAIFTEVSSPPCPFDLYDFIATAWAFIAFTPEYAGEIHVTSALAFGVYIVLIGRTPFFYSELQYKK